MTMRALVLIFCLALIASKATAAQLSSSLTKDGKVVIALDGEIADGDADAFTAKAREANSSGRLVSGLRLNSPGGSLSEAVKFSELIRYAKIATVVVNKAQCASACFVLFAAGYEKFANYTSSIGVHGASDGNGRETIRSGAATVSMARAVKELGVPPIIIGKMVTTPPEDMVWLSPAELRAMGVTLLGKPVQTPSPEVAEPSAPMQIAPTVQAKAAPSWDEFIGKAIALSSNQNNGKPNILRTCQPELKVCITGIYIKGNDDKDMLVKKTEDMSGKVISREFCNFNSFGDVRTCFDWDTNVKHRDMKDKQGNWFKVADE